MTKEQSVEMALSGFFICPDCMLPYIGFWTTAAINRPLCPLCFYLVACRLKLPPSTKTHWSSATDALGLAKSHPDVIGHYIDDVNRAEGIINSMDETRRRVGLLVSAHTT